MVLTMKVQLLSVLVLVTLFSCSTKTTNTTTSNIVYCKEPRSKICTMEYQPVCGVISEYQVMTYSNACVACSDAKVVSFVKHPCQPDVSE